MSDEQAKSTPESDAPDDNAPFSQQSTSMVEATLAETLGLSMHNAITNQQSAQMTTSASITNACARLLQTPTHIPAAQVPSSTEKLAVLPDNSEQDIEDVPEEDLEEVGPESPPAKKRFNLFKFLGKKDQAKQQDDHE